MIEPLPDPTASAGQSGDFDGLPGDDESSAIQDQPEIELTTETDAEADAAAAASIRSTLVSLGFVSFDSSSADNTTSGMLVSAEKRAEFRRDAYVGIRDEEQGREFLGRIVEGPFHSPHEVSAESAISRVSLLYPERTRFRPVYYVHGEIEVLGEIRDGERVVPTPTRPRPYSEVFIYPTDRLQTMLGLEGEVLLGNLLGYEHVRVKADIESKNFIPRNLGIFGTVGSGKSNSTQVLIEEATRSGWAVVVVDVEGEYVRMDEPTDDVLMAQILADDYGMMPEGVDDFRVYVPTSGTSDAASPIGFKVPISAIPSEVLSDIIDLSEPQQRMLGRLIVAATRTGGGGGQAARLGALAGSAPSATSRPYNLQTLIDGLDAEANYPLLGGNVRSTDQATAHVLRGKLIHLGRSGVLDSHTTTGVSELPVADLVIPGRLSVLDVSETDDRSRNIAISYLLQSLFDSVIATDIRQQMPNGHLRPPVLLVIEEVHTFVSRASVNKMRAVLDQLQIISRRGRKRWMGLALVSQQPGHVPDELFELANTRLIHQLKSTSNLAPVKQTTGGVHEALWGTVPALGPGQCLFTGAIFRNPIFVSMRPARSRRLLVT